MSDNQKETFTNEYIAKFQYAEPNYYERIPAIIDHLTYIESKVDEKTGETKWYRKRLDPVEKELYRVLKQSAGQQNRCWKNADTLASQVGCGNKRIGTAKEVLEQSFEQMEGRSLIEIEKIRVATTCKETQKRINTKPKHIISINHIWDYNSAFREVKEGGFPPMTQEISQEEAEMAIERMRNPVMRDIVDNKEAECQPTFSPHTQNVNEHDAPRGQNVREHCKQTTPLTDPIVKETNSSAEAAHLVFPSIDLLSSFSSEASAVKWLRELGVSKYAMKELRIADNLSNLLASAQYTLNKWRNSYDKPEIALIDNISGYFMNTYKNKWYS